MSVRIAWARGGEAHIVSIGADAIVLVSTVPWPPGSRIEGTVLLEGVDASSAGDGGNGDARAGTLRLKVHASRRRPEGDFLLEGRPIDLRRDLRVRLEAWVGTCVVACLGACVVACLAACSGAAKRETSSLISAVDRYRRADTASKPGEALAVSRVECTSAKVCDAKAACLAAIDPTTRALALKDEVAHRLVDLQEKRISPTSLEAQALPGKLDDATRLLQEGHTKMSDCDRQLTDLVVAFGG